MKPWILITPASRGIGLSIARRLIRTTNLPIVATSRRDLDKTREAILSDSYAPETDGYEGEDPSELEIAKPVSGAEERLDVVKLDVTDETSIADAAEHCRTRYANGGGAAGDKKNGHLHLAFVLTGKLYPEKSPKEFEYESLLDSFKTNTIGPMLMLKHFHGFLPRKATPVFDNISSSLSSSSAEATGRDLVPTRHATWATMSARVGSITDNNRQGGWYSYRASKAAVNQITKSFDNQLRMSATDNAIAISLHPGTVKTGLSKEFWSNIPAKQLFSSRFAAKKLLDVVAGLDTQEGRGKCWDWAGKEIPP